MLLDDPRDLIHKACGWMLREVGKRDETVLTDFLNRHSTKMPRTMLRYAIEKYPPETRQCFLKTGQSWKTRT
jgi:3-methyladenine DNA glycosylase AlkD